MPEIRWTELWSLRDAVDAQDRMGAWLPGRVVAVEKDRVKVHFKGWNAKFDEWIANTERLAPSGSRTSPAQLAEQEVAVEEGRDSRRMAKSQAATPPPRVQMDCIVPQRGRTRDARSIQLGSALIRLYKALFPKQTAKEPRLIGEAVLAHTSYVLSANRERFGQLELVGGVTVQLPDTHKFAVIGYIGTIFQRSGYGQRLIGAVCEHMRTVHRANDPLYTFADPAAVPFFLANGFVPVETSSAVKDALLDCGIEEPVPSQLLVCPGGPGRVEAARARQAHRNRDPVPHRPVSALKSNDVTRGGTPQSKTMSQIIGKGKRKAQVNDRSVATQSTQEYRTKKDKRQRLSDTPAKVQTGNSKRSCGAPHKKSRKKASGAAAEHAMPPSGTTRKSDQSHAGWVPREDQQLQKLIAREGPGDWQSKAQQFNTERSPNALRQRWYGLSKAAALKQQEEEYFKFVYGDQYQSTNGDTNSDTSAGAALSVSQTVMPVAASDPSATQWQNHVRGEDRNDDICSVCEEGGTLLCCEGPCSRAFHMACVGLIETPDDAFICPHCTKQLEICLLCHGEGPLSDMMRCMVPGCGRCFHKTCIPKLASVKKKGVPVQAPADTSLVCPRHMCVSCDDVPDKGSSLVRCIRCPVAYHKQCVPAGVVGSGRNIICPKHEEHPQTIQAWNIDCCVICMGGGSLVCCDTCIGAYHPRCIKHVKGFQKIKSGAWRCPECWFGIKPAMGAIVWAKFPSLPLWPAQIVDNAPPSIGLGPEGAFQVRLFGMQDQKDEWKWAHHANIGHWQESDHKRHQMLDAAGTANYDTTFSKALNEAHAMYKSHGPKQIAAQSQPRVMEYKKIVRSIRVPSTSQKHKRDEDDEPPCVCSLSTPCCSNSCLNRLCYIECNPKTCPAGHKCCNRRFQTRDYPKLRPFKVGERGMGLRAHEDVIADRFVIEYCGEVIDKAECLRRVVQQEAQGDMMFYAIALDANHYIDASFAGNLGRYVNHSCEPNMRVEKWNVLGETRVGFFATKDISKGTELTIDYQFSTIAGTGLLRAMQKCSCGSSQCRGFLGAKVGNDPDLIKGCIRPEWCETLEVGMRCDALCGNDHWHEATVVRMDDRAGITQLQLHFNGTDEDQNEWIPITAMKERMAPRSAMTGPEGQKKLAEIRRQQCLIDAEQTAKEAARQRRLEKARRRAAEKRAERRAIEQAARELAQRKASLTRKWNSRRLSTCQEECRRRGIWPGGNKTELADRIARVECGETLRQKERAHITREEMQQAREKKFAISKVLRHRVSASGKDEFLVRWKQHTASAPVEDTWEPRSSFEEGAAILKKWDEHAVDEIVKVSYQAAPELEPEIAKANAQTYTARGNEQLFRIALKVGTTLDKLVTLNSERYPNLKPTSKLLKGTILTIPSGARRVWKRSGHGWLGRVIEVGNVTRDLPADARNRQRPPRNVKVARYLVVAWSNGSVEVEPAWQLVNESNTREIELFEAEMVEFITRSCTQCSTARSSASSSNCSDLQQTTVEFGAEGPFEQDLDEQDGRWLLQGSQWLGRRVGRTFQAHNEHGFPSGLPIVAIGRVVAYKPAMRGYAAVRRVSVLFCAGSSCPVAASLSFITGRCCAAH
eukprot:COSAG02_NODE_763_length_17431_cov_18.031502_5_plen_1607_part_00